MYKKGIAIYVGMEKYSLKENLEYIRLAKQLGYESVFSSAHINEASFEIQELQILIDEISQLEMKLSLDISKKIYNKITLPKNIYALRLDYGFSHDEIIQIAKDNNFKVEINASTFTKDAVLKLLDEGIKPTQLRASFNYYPKRHTGHTIEFCKEIVSFYHQIGTEVSGFIPSHTNYRPPMYEGLPTVEKHRNMSLNLAIEELKLCGFDEITFGDAYASKEELMLLSNHQKEELLIEFSPYGGFNQFDYLLGVYKRRIDFNNELLRISKRQSGILPFNANVKRKPYDLTIDNDLFLRYSGEINIILQDLEPDERVNVVGHLHLSEFMIEYIKKGVPFCFIKN